MQYLHFGMGDDILGLVAYHISRFPSARCIHHHTEDCLLILYSCADICMNSD